MVITVPDNTSGIPQSAKSDLKWILGVASKEQQFFPDFSSV
jgi:hypothetical protein